MYRTAEPSARLFILLAASLTLAACAAPGAYGRATQQRPPGVDYCPERLPPAQQRIEELYDRAAQTPTGESVGATITGPNGQQISVQVGTTDDGGVRLDDVHTGLADLVFNCGSDFSEQECFVEIYMDGEQLADLGPNVDGQVPFRCLAAGRHQLRIESVGQTIYDGVITLDSDHEHLAQIVETDGGEPHFEIYAVNPLTDRIPPVPTRQNTARADVQYDEGYDDGYGDSYEQPRRHRDGRDTRRHHHRDRAPAAMSPADFDQLLASVEDESFSDGKLRVIKMAAKQNYFTADQAKQLVAAMSFGDNKVEAAVLLYPQLVDQGNFFKVMDAFTYDSNKEKVQKRLGLQ